MYSCVLFSNEYLTKTLDNGLQIVVKENFSNSSVGFFCFVKTGSLNEGKYLGAGISHYLEHVVSSGSTKFHSEKEYEQMGKEMGSIVNAYTTNVATVFHIITDKQYAEQALQILSEQMQDCSIDSMETAREKQVILKEIVMRSTPPHAKINQRFNELVYPNSNKKYPVIGYPNLFKKITRNELAEYYHQRYAPNNMIFVAVGDFDSKKMMEKIEKTFENFPRKQLQPVYQPTQHIRNGEIEYIEEFDIQQPVIKISTIISSSDYKDEPALNAALDILFSKRKSPIRYKLVEEKKLVNDRNFYAFADINPILPEGSVNITLEAKNIEDVKKIVKIIDEEIEKYSAGMFTEEDIRNYINRTKARKLLWKPDVETESNIIGWNMMMYGVPDSYDMMMEKLSALTPHDLENALKKHLLPKNRVILYAVPKGGKAILETQTKEIVEISEPEKISVGKNITLIFKKNTTKPTITGVICLPVSINYETPENAGTISFMTKMMFKGSKNYDSLDLTEWKEDHAVKFWVSVGNETFINFKCLKDDFPEMKQILFDAFQNPTFPENEIKLAKDAQNQDYLRSLSNAGRNHEEFRNMILYRGQRAGISNEKRNEIIQNLTQKDLFNLYKKYFNADKIIITLFGDLEKEEAEKIAKEFYSKIPHKKTEGIYTPLQIPEIDSVFINEYDFEQVNLNINYPAPKVTDEDYFAMKVIQTILGGNRGRIFNAVRGTNDLAYFAYPDYSAERDYGFFRITSQTSLDKKDELLQVLLGEIEKIKKETVSQEEINLAVEETQKIMSSYFTDNQLPYVMTSYENLGLGFDFIEKISEILKKITPEDVKTVANKYFQKAAIFISQPKKNVKLMVE